MMRRHLSINRTDGVSHRSHDSHRRETRNIQSSAKSRHHQAVEIGLECPAIVKTKDVLLIRHGGSHFWSSAFKACAISTRPSSKAQYAGSQVTLEGIEARLGANTPASRPLALFSGDASPLVMQRRQHLSAQTIDAIVVELRCTVTRRFCRIDLWRSRSAWRPWIADRDFPVRNEFFERLYCD